MDIFKFELGKYNAIYHNILNHITFVSIRLILPYNVCNLVIKYPHTWMGWVRLTRRQRNYTRFLCNIFMILLLKFIIRWLEMARVNLFAASICRSIVNYYYHRMYEMEWIFRGHYFNKKWAIYCHSLFNMADVVCFLRPYRSNGRPMEQNVGFENWGLKIFFSVEPVYISHMFVLHYTLSRSKAVGFTD